MTRDEIMRQYDVNKKGVILTPGRFAGQMLYIPYFWDKYLSGCADDTTGDFITFYITDDDRREFPELGQAESITFIEIGRTLICELPRRSTNFELKRNLGDFRSGISRLFKKKSALTADVSADGKVS
jgi:hypothetical protein